ncbi:toll-like receptor 1 [Acropora millepora]|uniref:toll-like receptor 1 n=1 Tax=Acropora millepora TaxID=45264 RepID=UPI001CF5B3BD|nr:toll-like receptor 1 [Acropora millepora]
MNVTRTRNKEPRTRNQSLGTTANPCGYNLPPPRVTTSQSTTTDAPTDHPKGKNVPIVPVVATCVTIAFVILVVAAVIWRCFVDKKKKEEDVALLDLGFKFDAFIIYSTTDEKWVKKKLLATLEKKHNIKCCIHYRDFLPGVPFVENMAQSVYNSRKTIAVVSKSFLSSNYCNHELNIALHRLVERGDDSVIVIKLDDVEDSKLPIELQFRSYIDFTKANDKKAWEYKLVHSFGGERC